MTGRNGAELAELVRAVEAERPVPREEFTRALDERIAAALRSPDRNGGSRRVRSKLTPLAMGGAAAIFIVAVAVVSSGVISGQDGGRSAVRGDRGGRATAAGKQETRVSPVPGSAALPAPPDVAPAERARKVVRSAALTLAASRDDVENVADGVVRTTDRYGGFVYDSNVSSGDSAGATLDLRIPSTRLQPALADLSKLAHVQSRSQATQDITARFVSPRRRLAEATAERSALLRQLARAATPNETASVRARLRLANRSIDSARAVLRRLETRVDYAGVSVSVVPGSTGDGGPWSAGDAAGDAVGVLTTMAGAALIGMAALAPVALLFAIGLVVRRAHLKRARETALGPVEKPSGR